MLGVEFMPIGACLEVIVALAGERAAPWIGPDRWVTCAEYMPSVIVVMRVAAENPVTSVPGFTAAVAAQVMLGVPGMSTGSTSGYPPMPGVLPDSSDVNFHPSGVFTDPPTNP